MEIAIAQMPVLDRNKRGRGTGMYDIHEFEGCKNVSLRPNSSVNTVVIKWT